MVIDLLFTGNCADYLGSTRVAVSSDGQSGVGYSYDALGNVIVQSAFGNPTFAIAYQYTGQEYDVETGLHNFRARLYDSDLFRFYSTDPAGEQHSPYSFVGNSPLMFRDPTGEFIIETLLGMAIYGAINAGADIIRSDFKMNIGQIGESFGKGALRGGLAALTAGQSDLGPLALQLTGSAISSQLPSVGINIGGASINLSPTFALGSDGISFGADLSTAIRIGDFVVGNSFGASTTVGSQVAGLNGGFARAQMFAGVNTENFSLIYSNTIFQGSSDKDFNQRVGALSVGGKGWSFTHTNDVLAIDGDKGRTAALQLSIGNFVVGANIYTNNGQYDEASGTGGETRLDPDDQHKVWKNGKVYSSPLYFGYNFNGNVYSAGIDAPFVQSAIQNTWHKYAEPIGLGAPYFQPGNYLRPYGRISRYNRFIY